MTIAPDHWLTDARRETIPGGGHMPVRRFLVIHFTAGVSALSSIGWWKKQNNGILAHLVIDRDGTIYQCRPFDRTCGHAGPSRWKDPNTGITYLGLNTCSIGIELANAGANAALCSRWGFPTAPARHKHGGPCCDWETYPAAQVASCTAVSRTLVTRYNLDDVIGHDDIAPSRKTDPGPLFPMSALRQACGFPPDIPNLNP